MFANTTSHRSPDEELQMVEVLDLKKKKKIIIKTQKKPQKNHQRIEGKKKSKELK